MKQRFFIDFKVSYNCSLPKKKVYITRNFQCKYKLVFFFQLQKVILIRSCDVFFTSCGLHFLVSLKESGLHIYLRVNLQSTLNEI